MQIFTHDRTQNSKKDLCLADAPKARRPFGAVASCNQTASASRYLSGVNNNQMTKHESIFGLRQGWACRALSPSFGNGG